MIYEYKCDECDHITELNERISAKHPESIPCDLCLRPTYRIYGHGVKFKFIKGKGGFFACDAPKEKGAAPDGGRMSRIV